MEQTEQLALLRRLKFFHDFSQAEIGEVLMASSWHTCAPNEEVVREGDMDERFYVVVAGSCVVQRNGRTVGAAGHRRLLWGIQLCTRDASFRVGAHRWQCHAAEGRGNPPGAGICRPASCDSTGCSCAP